MNDQWQTFFQLVSARERFMVCCHVHPDGDAIGSLLAVGLTLKNRNKQVAMVCSDGAPTVYHFLEGSGEITREFDAGFCPEVLICVDCAEKERVAAPPEIWTLPDVFVVNLDHHVTNIGFGDLNIIDPQACATGELVYRIFAAGGYGLDGRTALAIYTALATDTGFFRYESTSAYTLEVAADLVKNFGVNPSKVAEEVHDHKSFNSVRMLGEALGRLRLANDGKVAWMVLDQQMLKKFPVENEETDNYVNFARSIEGVEIGLLFKELKSNEIKLSWRSSAAVDVSQLAAYFGGGGHARAAGCSLTGSVDTVIQRVLKFINEYYGAKHVARIGDHP